MADGEGGGAGFCREIFPGGEEHRWDLNPYPFLVVITQLFSCIIFINDCICVLTGSPG